MSKSEIENAARLKKGIGYLKTAEYLNRSYSVLGCIVDIPGRLDMELIDKAGK